MDQLFECLQCRGLGTETRSSCWYPQRIMDRKNEIRTVLWAVLRVPDMIELIVQFAAHSLLLISRNDAREVLLYDPSEQAYFVQRPVASYSAQSMSISDLLHTLRRRRAALIKVSTVSGANATDQCTFLDLETFQTFRCTVTTPPGDDFRYGVLPGRDPSLWCVTVTNATWICTVYRWRGSDGPAEFSIPLRARGGYDRVAVFGRGRLLHLLTDFDYIALDARSGQWTRRAAAPLLGRLTYGLVECSNGDTIVCGGYGMEPCQSRARCEAAEDREALSSCMRYDVKHDGWKAIAPLLEPVQDCMAVMVDEDRLLVWDREGRTDHVQEYLVSVNLWKWVPVLPNPVLGVMSWGVKAFMV